MRTYKIKEIAQIINGSTPSTKNKTYWNGNIVWITPSDLSSFNGKYIYTSNKLITKEGYDSCSTTLVPKGTVLLSSKASIGYLAIAGVELCTSQGFKSLVCNPDLINNEYMYYWLSTKIKFFNSISSGAVMKELTKDILENINIELPNLESQQHIVNTIGSVDDLIEFNNKIIDKLKIYSDLIYQDYLNRLYNNTSVKLGDYCEIKTGKLNVNSAVENGRYPFFTCGSEYLYINNYAYDCKAIIISGNGVITCKYYDGKFNAYQRTYVLTPKKYFYLFLKSCEFEVNNLNINSSGSVIKFITKSMIEKISIILNIYSSITDDKIAKIYNLISKYKQQNIKLQKIKQNLLNKYF